MKFNISINILFNFPWKKLSRMHLRKHKTIENNVKKSAFCVNRRDSLLCFNTKVSSYQLSNFYFIIFLRERGLSWESLSGKIDVQAYQLNYSILKYHVLKIDSNVIKICIKWWSNVYNNKKKVCTANDTRSLLISFTCYFKLYYHKRLPKKWFHSFIKKIFSFFSLSQGCVWLLSSIVVTYVISWSNKSGSNFPLFSMVFCCY